uniref:Uncharacterized protein n=1 Tax=Bartonella schoenbuchensis (strain DSM 13525 / NCTC 13165 / R1) TaxID=687861 RepID=E6Z182_BARSR|nr:hypothetical protein BARSC_190141 [Bartonella schoenbuchensis R1]
MLPSRCYHIVFPNKQVSLNRPHFHQRLPRFVAKLQTTDVDDTVPYTVLRNSFCLKKPFLHQYIAKRRCTLIKLKMF